MDDVFQWLDQWWFLYSEWFPDPEPLTGPKWDTLVYRGTRLPDVVNDVDIRPLKRLLRAMVAWGAPSIINGPQLSPERLQEVSSEAWAAYQQLQMEAKQVGQVGHSKNNSVPPEDVGEVLRLLALKRWKGKNLIDVCRHYVRENVGELSDDEFRRVSGSLKRKVNRYRSRS